MASDIFAVNLGTMFSSMIGVWNGTLCLATDFVRTGKKDSETAAIDGYSKTPHYRIYLLYLALPPTIFLTLDKLHGS